MLDEYAIVIPMTTSTDGLPVADIFDLAIVDGAAVDASANAAEMVTKGNPTVGTDKIDFDGTSSYQVPSFKNHYTSLTDGFSVELCFTTGTNLTDYQVIMGNFHAGGFGLEVENGLGTFCVRLGDGYKSAKTASPLTANTTYHFVGTYDATTGTLSLYVNGALVGTAQSDAAMGLPTDTAAQYLVIGADSDASGAGEYPFSGSVSIASIYSETLTAAQAAALYEAAK